MSSSTSADEDESSHEIAATSDDQSPKPVLFERFSVGHLQDVDFGGDDHSDDSWVSAEHDDDSKIIIEKLGDVQLDELGVGNLDAMLSRRMLRGITTRAEFKNFKKSLRAGRVNLDNQDHDLPTDPEAVRLARTACAHLESAWEGHGKYTILDEPTKSNQRLFVHLWRSNLSMLVDFFVLMLLFVSMFERPSWCGGNGQVPDPCHQVINSGFPIFTRATGTAIESILLILIAVDIVTSKFVASDRRWFSSVARPIRAFTVLVAFFDCAILNAVIPQRHFRLSPYLRPIIAATSWTGMRSVLISVSASFRRLVVIGALEVLWTAFCAWCGLILFADVDAGPLPPGAPTPMPVQLGNHTIAVEGAVPFFSNFFDAMWDLFVLTTTANYPDVALPAIRNNTLYTLFYLLFLSISLWLLMNLALAVIFAEYSDAATAHMENRMLKRRVGTLLHAHSVIVEAQNVEARALLARGENPGNLLSDELCFTAFCWLTTYLTPYWSIPTIRPAQSKLYFIACDIENDGFLAPAEFIHIAEVLDITFVDLRKRTFLHRLLADKTTGELPKYYKWFRFIVLHRYFDLAVDLLIVINTIFTALEVFIPWFWNWSGFETVFVILYCLDQLLKIIAHGSFFAYWNDVEGSGFQRFDFLVTLSSLISQIFSYQKMQVIRVLRLLRLLVLVKDFREFARSYVLLIPRLVPVLGVLFSILLLFTYFGMDIFGGYPLSAFQGTLYYENDYSVLNFNDFWSTNSLLFSLLVVNNWFIFSDAYSHVVQTSAARLYFVAFWTIGVVVALNVVVATIVDQVGLRALWFSAQWLLAQFQDATTEEDGVDEALLTGLSAVGRPGSTSRRFVARRRVRRRAPPPPANLQLDEFGVAVLDKSKTKSRRITHIRA